MSLPNRARATPATRAVYSVEDWALAKRQLYVAFSLLAESTGCSIVSPSDY